MSGALFWRLDTPRGELVLRRWPTEHPSPERLRFIHAVLQHASQRGVSILPLPIATADGESFVSHAGHLWELARWLPGTADYERAPSPAKLRAALAALAKFHQATADFRCEAESDTTSSAVGRRLPRLRELESVDFTEMAAPIAGGNWPGLGPVARRFVELLPRAVPLATSWLAPLAEVPLVLQPCLRDVWHDHVLFTGDEVTGLLDCGAIDVDSPTGDVARLLGSFVSDDEVGWRVGLEAYAAIRPLSPDERRTIVALDAAGTVLAGCNWIRWIYVEGRTFENPPQVERRFQRLLERLEQLVRRGAPVIGDP